MRDFKKVFLRVLFFVVVGAMVFSLGGCGGAFKKSKPMPSYCRTELTFLLPQPYSRVYVEIDRIEGVDLPEGALEDLEIFLNKYCLKPDGIELVRDDVIPESEYKGRSAGIVANLFIDGPSCRVDDGKTAYMYILVYDSKKMGRQRCLKAHVSFPYSCMIYYDINSFRLLKNHIGRNVLLHEASHVLGLCKNTEHGDGAHCFKKGCLIYPTVSAKFFKVLFGKPAKKLELCDDCQRDIAMLQAENRACKMSFNGPFLVRQEDGYWIACLPVCDLISISGADRFDWRQMLAKMKQTVKNNEDFLRENPNAKCCEFTLNETGESAEEKKKMLLKLKCISKDPAPIVGKYVEDAIRELEAELVEKPQ